MELIIGFLLSLLYLIPIILATGLFLTYCILSGIGVKKIVKRRGIYNRPMFIPISYFIRVAKIADHYNAQARNKQTRYKYAIAWLSVGFIIVSAFMELIPVLAPALAMIFPFLGGALAVAALILIVVMASLMALLFIAIVVISYICFYYIFASCVPDHKVLFLLLSIFTCMPGLFVFIVRKSDMGMPAQEAVPAADTAAEESVLAPVQ